MTRILGRELDLSNGDGAGVIERVYIHVGGPPGAGKTTFVETLLRGVDRYWLAARCVRNDSLRRSRETSPRIIPSCGGTERRAPPTRLTSNSREMKSDPTRSS